MFDAWKLRRAARQFANRLPKELVRDYGVREFYTEPQIRNAIATAKLNFKYAVLGYARFLSREHFEAMRVALDVKLAYNDARELFVNAEPIILNSRQGKTDRNYSNRNYEEDKL